MRVKNFKSLKGNPVPNQFLITGITCDTFFNNDDEGLSGGELFQSYESNIAFRDNDGTIYLDKIYWDYSVTTKKYLSRFLDENIKTIREKIDSGEYELINLNED